MRVKDLAAELGLAFEGDGEREITACAPVESAGEGDVSFVAGAKAAKLFDSAKADCLVVPLDLETSGRTVIRAADPRGVFGRIIARLHPQHTEPPSIHPTAIIHPTAQIGADVAIGPYCTVGARVVLGDGVRLYPQVTIYPDVTIGARTILHSGAVIGSDGFGYALQEDGHYEKFPQVGKVVIGSDVEIGANSCVDRAALGRTVIGDGTKLDNMVHVGHNCIIGKHVVIAAQCGLAGGVRIGDYAVLAGQVGVADKVRIEAKAIIGAQAGIPSNKIIRAVGPVWGTPAQPLKEHLEQLAHLRHLGDLRKEVAELRRLVAEKS